MVIKYQIYIFLNFRCLNLSNLSCAWQRHNLQRLTKNNVWLTNVQWHIYLICEHIDISFSVLLNSIFTVRQSIIILICYINKIMLLYIKQVVNEVHIYSYLRSKFRIKLGRCKVKCAIPFAFSWRLNFCYLLCQEFDFKVSWLFLLAVVPVLDVLV